jgi:hypothetical protein
MLVLKNNEIAQRHMALNMHRFSIRLNRHARFGIRRINNCHFYGLRCRPSFDDHKSGQVRIFQKRRGLATWRVRIARVSVVRVRVVIILPTSSQAERQTLELPRLGQKARTPSPRNWQQGRPTGSRSRSRSSSVLGCCISEQGLRRGLRVKVPPVADDPGSEAASSCALGAASLIGRDAFAPGKGVANTGTGIARLIKKVAFLNEWPRCYWRVNRRSHSRLGKRHSGH